jgi:predicted translin family RNA/ssDNA-binding protein
MLYYDYVYHKKLRTPEELKITADDYLGALSDLTGELARKAVHYAIKKNFDAIYEISECISAIHKEMMNFSFRNSSLRKKSDAIKWNMNKVEDILYDIEMKRK